MLNGLDPIFLFNFFKLTAPIESFVQKIPIVDSIVSKIGLPAIPLYLSESLTGIYIDSESKNIAIETSTETLSNGQEPKTTQKGINSILTINMLAKKNSIGLILLSSFADEIFPRVTSREYSISYLHQATTIFNGLLHDFAVQGQAGTDLIQVQVQLSRSTGKTTVVSNTPVVQRTTGVTPDIAGVGT